MPYSDPEKRAEHQRRMKYKRVYGITIEDYDRMLEEQGGRCAICRTDTPGGSGSRFAVDHNHEQMKFVVFFVITAIEAWVIYKTAF